MPHFFTCATHMQTHVITIENTLDKYIENDNNKQQHRKIKWRQGQYSVSTGTDDIKLGAGMEVWVVEFNRLMSIVTVSASMYVSE